jgi:hypothetical protein
MKSPVLPGIVSCILTLLACGSIAAWADLSPERLAAFRLEGSPLLRGFARARPEAKRPAPLFGRPPGATAALNEQFFRGSSELRYSVLLFPTKQALADWDRSMRSSAPGWFSPLRQPVRNGVQESRLGGVVRPNLPPARAIVVNRVLITIGVSQHEEMTRRHPELAEQGLTDEELAERMGRVRQELIRRAKALSANR